MRLLTAQKIEMKQKCRFFFVLKTKLKTNSSYLFNNHILNRSDIKAFKKTVSTKYVSRNEKIKMQMQNMYTLKHSCVYVCVLHYVLLEHASSQILDNYIPLHKLDNNISPLYEPNFRTTNLAFFDIFWPNFGLDILASMFVFYTMCFQSMPLHRSQTIVLHSTDWTTIFLLCMNCPFVPTQFG